MDGGGAASTCSFPDGDNATTVAIKVTDEDGASDVSTESVRVVDVSNLAPVYDRGCSAELERGRDHTFGLGSFSDAGALDYPWTIHVEWGDSSSSEFTRMSQGLIPATAHTYAQTAATRSPSTVTDKDGGADGARSRSR